MEQIWKMTGCFVSWLRSDFFIPPNLFSKPSWSFNFKPLKLPIISENPLQSPSRSSIPAFLDCGIWMRSLRTAALLGHSTDAYANKRPITVHNQRLLFKSRESDLSKRIHDEHALNLDRKGTNMHTKVDTRLPFTFKTTSDYQLRSPTNQPFSGRLQNSRHMVHVSSGCSFVTPREHNSTGLLGNFTCHYSSTSTPSCAIVSLYAIQKPKVPLEMWIS